MPDWVEWLNGYDRPRSPLRQRLRTTRRLISRELDRTAPRPVSILSICAGDGRDILDVLAERDDASRARAMLIELDARLCLLARARARRNGLGGREGRGVIEVVRADAGASDTYLALDKADVAILVGVFGNVEDGCTRSTIAALGRLCRRDALVVWARRNEPASIADIREGFAAEGFDETYSSRSNAVYHVGAHRLAREPGRLVAAERFFSFANQGAGGRTRAA